MKRQTHLAFLGLLACVSASAYDFSATNADGQDLYFDFTTDGNAALTFRQRGEAAYSGDLTVPETVGLDGNTYRVTAVGHYAFGMCDALTSVTLPASVAEIPANAFDGCLNLTDIKVKGSAHFTSRDGALYTADGSTLVALAPGYEGDFTIAEGVERIADRALGGCPFVTAAEMPESVTEIGSDALYFCNWLRDITISPSVVSIGHAALADCASLRSISVADSNPKYTAEAGVLYDKNQTTLLQCPGAGADFGPIPSSVTAVGPMAMFRNMGVTTVKLPEGLTTISQGAFADAQMLTTIELPSTITSIGSMALAMCPALKSIYIDVADPAKIELGVEAFAGVDKYICTLYVPLGSRKAYKDAAQWGDFINISETDGLTDQVITWDSRHNSADKSVALTASSSAFLPVGYSISPASDGVAVITDNVLTSIVPGAVTVTAYQGGNSKYRPAVPVSRTFFANESGIDDITAEDPVKVYGAYGNIIIKYADPGAVARVYTPDGACIYTGTDRQIPVAGGNIYIVHVQGRAHKIAVR